MSTRAKLVLAAAAWAALVASAQDRTWRVPGTSPNTNRWHAIETRQRRYPRIISVLVHPEGTMVAWRATARTNVTGFLVERAGPASTNVINVGHELSTTHRVGEPWTTYFWLDTASRPEHTPFSYRVKATYPLWTSEWSQAMQATAPVGATPK